MLGYFWLGTIAGLAAAPHCAGMCGPFALHLSAGSGSSGVSPNEPHTHATRASRATLGRQVSYLAGKTLTYVFLGALAGLAGGAVMKSRSFSFSRDWFSYLLGAVTIAVGLSMLGAFRQMRFKGFGRRGASRCAPTEAAGGGAGVISPVLQQMYGALFRSPGVGGSFLLGIATGFLPCPITLAMALAAAATKSLLGGMVMMGGLGLGTSVSLLAIGMSGALVNARWRGIGLRGAGAIVVLIGVTALLRPTGVFCRILPHLGP